MQTLHFGAQHPLLNLCRSLGLSVQVLLVNSNRSVKSAFFWGPLTGLQLKAESSQLLQHSPAEELGALQTIIV